MQSVGFYIRPAKSKNIMKVDDGMLVSVPSFFDCLSDALLVAEIIK
jgi:hypothetical protein